MFQNQTSAKPGLMNSKTSRFLSVSLLLICLISLLPRLACAEHNGNIRVLLLGDSTTAGQNLRRFRPTGPHLEQVIQTLLKAETDMPDAEVINSGKGSEYIRGLLDSGRYDKEVSGLTDLDYIFVRYGLNDHHYRKNFHDEFTSDFYELIGKLRKDHPRAKIILMTVIPFSGEKITTEINSCMREIAEKEQLPLFDIHPVYQKFLDEQGVNAFNYRIYPLSKIPEKYHLLVQPYVNGGQVFVDSNELDHLLGTLPGWYGDRHPNLAGYNIIATETAKYLINDIRNNSPQQ